MPSKGREQITAQGIVPSGVLKRLSIKEIRPSLHNPRHLFDEEPLRELRDNIRQHGVLVPITVYQLKGQDRYAILDGERRYRCCVDLEREGLHIEIPANIVEPPSKIAGMLYMFSIHNIRESWELMPTALSLKVVMEALGEQDSKKLARLTGLSEPQVERCKVLLEFPERFQQLSLDPNPKSRIPANFWIEVNPVLDRCQQVLPELYKKEGRWGVLDRLVEKYRDKKIKSVIHFRRILEAFDVGETEEQRERVSARLRDYILDISLETRRAFDEFVVDSRRVGTAISACEEFVAKLEKAKLDHAVEQRAELTATLIKVKGYIDQLLQKLAGSDPPDEDAEGGKAERSK